MASDGNLRPIFRQYLTDIFWTSIETGSTGRGIPDSFGIIDSFTFWAEFKITEANALSTLFAEQVAWHLRYARCGGISFIIVRQRCEAGPRREARDNLYIFRGREAAKLKASGLKGAKPLGSWIGTGPASWDWPGIQSCLLK